jgi:hypothetical protein
MGVPGFFAVGGDVKNILTGGKDGVYQFDQKFSLATKTSDGVALALNAINKGDKADLSLRSSYR